MGDYTGKDQYASNQLGENLPTNDKKRQNLEGKGHYSCGCKEGKFRFQTHEELETHWKEHGPTYGKGFFKGKRYYRTNIPRITKTTRKLKKDLTDRDSICGCGKMYVSAGPLKTHI